MDNILTVLDIFNVRDKLYKFKTQDVLLMYIGPLFYLQAQLSNITLLFQ